MPLAAIPVGTIIHNIEMKPGAGGKIARAAGTYAQLVGKDAGWAQIKLGSGELRMVRGECMASIGAVSNPDNMNQKIGKAGRTRWLGKRPHNRGVVMNPVDHPLGGGEGRSSGGRHPVTPWGKPTKGYKTRGNKRTDAAVEIRFDCGQFGRASSGLAMGPADQGLQDAAQQAHRQIDHPAPQQGQVRWRVPSGRVRSSTAICSNKAEASRASGRNEIIRIWSRRSTILPQFVGLTFGVYNGHKFLPVQVNENMVGHKFGEFSPTRTFTGHSGDKRARRVMSKPSHPRRLADTEAQAIVSNLRVSPRKLNLVAGLIRNQPAAAGGGDADLLQAPHRAAGEEGAGERDRQCREQPSARRRPAGRVARRGGALGGDAPVPCARPRARGARREVVQPSEDRRRRTRAGSRGRRPHRWVTRSIRSGCGSASTAPGTAAGSPAPTIPSCCTRT